MTGSAQLVEKLILVDDLMKFTCQDSFTKKTLLKNDPKSKTRHLDFKKKNGNGKDKKGTAGKKKVEKIKMKNKIKASLVSASLDFSGAKSLKGGKTITSKKKKKNPRSSKAIYLNSKG